MIPRPGEDADAKFMILEPDDIIEAGDEWYNPALDIWKTVTDGDMDEDGYYPDAVIGYGWDPDVSKPVRRKYHEKQYL